MTDPKQVHKLAAKLVKAMSTVGVVEKRGSNTKQGYKYVKATDVANEVRTALIAEGVAFNFVIEHDEHWERLTNSGGTLFFCSLIVRGDFIDSETGETLSGRAIGWGADSLDKAPYKAMTGALKYLLRMNFLIPDEEDPEQENEHYEREHAPAPKAADKPAPSQSTNGKLITEGQQKRLFAIARKAGAIPDDVKRVLKHCGFSASKDIPMKAYDEIINLFESGQWADIGETAGTSITDDDLPF